MDETDSRGGHPIQLQSQVLIRRGYSSYFTY